MMRDEMLELYAYKFCQGATNQDRQSVSPFSGCKIPAQMPLMPAIFPSSSSIAEALRPIRIPPSSEANGAKLCTRESSGSVRSENRPCEFDSGFFFELVALRAS